MAFTHDTEVSLEATVALVNSGEDLSTQADLAAFVARWQLTGTRTGTAAELAAVQAIRPRLRAIWSADDEHAVEIVNTLLQEARALPLLVRHDHWGWHLHATPRDAPLAARLAVEAAMAMVDVIRMDELDRLRVCAAEDCDDVLVDLSRNRSRRFCDGGCGNRANVAAYRARRATLGSDAAR